MSAPIRIVLLSAALLSLASAAAQGGELALERLFWADPELSEASLRVSRSPESGTSVRAVVSTRAAADRAHALLARELGLEHFQVDVDPRLRRDRAGPAGDSGISLALAALKSDAGTRPHAGLLDAAEVDASGTLWLREPEGLDAPSLRRVARLVLAQPGISALRFSASGSAAPSPPRTTPEPPPTRTRLELDPLQPEASELASEEAKPRTRLHVDLPTAPTETQPPEPAAPATQAAETAPPDDRAAVTRAESTELDDIVEAFLAEALKLEGAPETLKARVRSGVVVFGGQVESRELALRLRELTRNFDSVKRVTGGLRVESTGERVAMDALPD